MNPKPPFPFVRVTWRDAYAKASTDEFVVSDVERMDSWQLTVTVGFLLRKTRLAVYLAQDWQPAQGPDEYDQWRGVTVIPRAIVVEVVAADLQTPRGATPRTGTRRAAPATTAAVPPARN